ncbi:MAG TPA: septal ring lytic transglycosylase RlpA family protein [Usitatibacter sp.]
MRRIVAALVIALVAAGCATTPRKSAQGEAPKKPSYYSDDGPPDAIPGNLASIPNAVPRDEPFHRYANRPYTVFGHTYVPVVNKETYRQRGIASWYGKKFQGQKTASGEPYDMFAMTAAHPTLPIPSYARVTNVKTGQWVVVRINDRGPFHSNRVIDLSYAAAARIGVASPGSALVDVERVFESPEPRSEAAPVLSPAAQIAVETPVVVEEAAGLWLQLGAFSSRDGAESFRDHATRELAWNHEPVQVTPRDGLYRVRLGPYRNREEALAIADKVRETLGFAPTLINR